MKSATFRVIRDAPADWGSDAAILIQFSPDDEAWLAMLITTPVPPVLGRRTADGPTPAKALAALDELLGAIAEEPDPTDV